MYAPLLYYNYACETEAMENYCAIETLVNKSSVIFNGAF
jgi:hypothetical protein